MSKVTFTMADGSVASAAHFGRLGAVRLQS